MRLGTSLGRRAMRRLRSRSALVQPNSASKSRRLARAIQQPVESLESRVFLHAGPHLAATAEAPYNGQQKVSASANVTVTFATALNTATINSTNFELRDASNNLVPATVTYNATTKTATLDPTGTLATSNNYFTARVKSGATGVFDTTGLGLDEDLTWSFTTGTPIFSESTVYSGLIEPTNIQFSPDGRVFVAEKSGLIKVFASLTATTPTIFADLRTQVHNFWDRGLLGLALDPQFTAGRPYVYVLYTYDGNVGGAAPKYGTVGGVSDPGPDATGNGALVSGRLSRLTASGNTMLAGSEKVLINDWQQQFPSHSVGSIAFGPDGALYASAGDGASFNYADYGQTGNPFADPTNEGGAVRAQDLQTPNDSTTLDGSFIRVNPDTGDALVDNPLYVTGKDASAKRIIAEGFRNPFRFTFRPGTNEIWAGDVGWNTWEELNRLTVSTTAVSNYGWPAYEGPNRQSGYDALNLPVLENLYAQGTSAVVTPYYAYQHSEKVVAGSAEPTGGSSITGVSFYTGANYPSAYQDALFFTDYSRKAIYVMYKGPDGNPDPSTRQLFKLGTGSAYITTGPGGDLFYVDLLNGRIQRFSYTPTTANSGLNATYFDNIDLTGTTVARTDPNIDFDWGTGSPDAGIGADTFSARWTGRLLSVEAGTYSFRATADDGIRVWVNGQQIVNAWVDQSPTSYIGTITLAAGTRYDIKVEYYENGGGAVARLEWQRPGATAFTAVPVLNLFTADPVANRAPTALITQDKTSGVAPLTVNFSAASSTDPDGDTLTYAWDLNGDGVFTDSTAINPSRTYTAAGTYTVGLKVTDSKGATSQASVVITAGNTAPTATITAPLSTLKWAVGSTINFAGTGTDPQDGNLPAANLKWQLYLRHENLTDPANFHYHLIQEYTGSSGSFIAPDHEYPSKLELRLVATDSGGLASTAAVLVLQPQTTTINIAANVAGVQVGFNSDTFAAPATTTVIVGSQNSLVAITPQTINGVVYNFTGWSDGQAATHLIVASASTVTYTANYTAATALPAPWAGADIGPVGLSGNSGYDPGTGKFTINGAGADIWGNSDSFRFVYQPLNGDGSIVARVVSLQQTNSNAKAGVQFRQSLSADSANVQMDLEGALNWAEFHARATAGGATSTASTTGPNPPYWVKLTRAGDIFSGFVSADGVTWQLVSTATVSMTAQVFVGLAVCSHDTTKLNTAVFDNVTVAAAPVSNLPAPWAGSDIGPVGLPGNGAYDSASGKFTLNGAGADIWGTSDSFRYTYQTLSGDGSIVARVVSLQQTNNNAKAGVQFRQSLSADSANVQMDLEGALNWAEFHARATAAGATTTSNAIGPNPPYWVKLVRSGDLFSGYVSSDGATWQLVGSATVTMSAQVYVGLAVCSHDVSKLNTAVFDNVTVAAASTVDVTAGLTHRYKLDENTGTTAGDSVGVKTGVLSSGATWAAGKSGSAVDLNGTTGVIDTNTDLSTDLGGTATLTAWIKTTQVGTTDFWLAPGIVGSEQNGGGNDVFWGILDPLGRIAVKAGDGAGATSTSAVNDGQWHFVAFTRNATTGLQQVYVDGILQASVTGETGNKTTPFQAFGRIEHDATNDVYYKGGLDDLRIYNRVLTAAEVLSVKSASAAAPLAQTALRTVASTTPTSATFSSARINFQPAAATAVAGYNIDNGSPYAARAGGMTYGWNTNHTANVYDRNKNVSQLLDTVLLMKAGAKWEMALPSGTYSVKVSVGDASAAATNTLNVEGKSLFAKVATGANKFVNKTLSVVVTDGRLTLDNGAAAALATRLNYIEITRTGSAPAVATVKATTTTSSTSTPSVMSTLSAKTTVNGVVI